jgi:hypothetical protein
MIERFACEGVGFVLRHATSQHSDEEALAACTSDKQERTNTGKPWERPNEKDYAQRMHRRDVPKRRALDDCTGAAALPDLPRRAQLPARVWDVRMSRRSVA